MTQLQNSPLLRKCHDVMQAIEACGASEQLTRAVVLAGELLRAIEKYEAIDAAAWAGLEAIEAAGAERIAKLEAEREADRLSHHHAVTAMQAALERLTAERDALKALLRAASGRLSAEGYLRGDHGVSLYDQIESALAAKGADA